MSILVKEDYANPTIPLWAKAGSGTGGGGVVSVNAGYGISITGTGTDPIINNSGVLGIYSATKSTAGIKISNTSGVSILGTTVFNNPINQKTRVDISYSIRVYNSKATTDNYFIDPVLNGTSIRTGDPATYDYTTSGNQHYQTVCGVVSGVIVANSLGYGTFDLFMNNQNGVGELYVYSVNAVISVSAI